MNDWLLDPELTEPLKAAQSCLGLALASLFRLLLLLWIISKFIFSARVSNDNSLYPFLWTRSSFAGRLLQAFESDI